MDFINEPDYEYVQDPMGSIGLGGGLVMLQHDPDIVVQLDSQSEDYGWIFNHSNDTNNNTNENEWKKVKQLNENELMSALEQAADMTVLKPTQKPLNPQSRIIENSERKVSVELSADKNRMGTYDYAIRIYGDGSMDEKPGARPFKVTVFQGLNARLDAKNFFNEKVSSYEQSLGAQSRLGGMASVIENIKKIKQKVFGTTNKNNKNHTKR